MKRTERTTTAKETVDIVERGYYTLTNGHTVTVAPAVMAAKRGTVLYDLGAMPALPDCVHAEATHIEVTGESTFQALYRLAAAGHGSLGCLNFASAKNPGGGFLNGAQAQEEALARSSALYDCLLCAPAYYERNRANRSCIYLDLAIVSPDVPFFRTDDGALLDQPVLATVITSPAPNAGAVRRNEPEHAAAIRPALIRRAEMVLRAAVLHDVRNFVLGAWGCGVFRNDPAHVAGAFAELLKPGARYASAFDRVVFAVFDPEQSKPNFAAFRDTLASFALTT